MIPVRYQKDKMFRNGNLHFKKMHNARVIINVPNLDSGNEKVLFKFIRYCKDQSDYLVNTGSTKSHSKRGVMVTYLILSREAYAFLTQVGIDLIAENYDYYTKFGVAAK